MSDTPRREPLPGGPADDLEDAEYISTRFLSETFELEGVKFSWWAIDEDPTFVTVSSELFGTESGFTRKPPEALAKRLAENLLRSHYTAPTAGPESGEAGKTPIPELDELLDPTDTVALPEDKKPAEHEQPQRAPDRPRKPFLT